MEAAPLCCHTASSPFFHPGCKPVHSFPASIVLSSPVRQLIGATRYLVRNSSRKTMLIAACIPTRETRVSFEIRLCSSFAKGTSRFSSPRGEKRKQFSLSLSISFSLSRSSARSVSKKERQKKKKLSHQGNEGNDRTDACISPSQVTLTACRLVAWTASCQVLFTILDSPFSKGQRSNAPRISIFNRRSEEGFETAKKKTNFSSHTNI